MDLVQQLPTDNITLMSKSRISQHIFVQMLDLTHIEFCMRIQIVSLSLLTHIYFCMRIQIVSLFLFD